MLYYDFKNYEEFNEIFGIIEHGNGVKSRRNKILLSVYKDRSWLRHHIRCTYERNLLDMADLYNGKIARACARNLKNYAAYVEIRDWLQKKSCITANVRIDPLRCKTLPVLKGVLMDALHERMLGTPDANHSLYLNGYWYCSDSFETDDMDGLCEDGTLNSIRYRNIEKERVFKMKAGKMFNHIMSCNTITRDMPEQIQRWLSEEFVADWIEYARQNIGDVKYQLHVDDNFCAIYSSGRCVGNFGSCMVDDGQWTFYRDAVDAKAAYLTNENDEIVARCIVFTDVKDEDGNKWRLAERQYSKDSDLSLQRQLVMALIRDGHIDGYKKVGASCSDASAFLDNEGNSLECKEFKISCRLCFGDTLSYQDSFKWYDYDRGIAANYEMGDYDLGVTDSRFGSSEDDCWSEYNQEYISEDEVCYVDTRDDYFYSNQVLRANVWNSYNKCFHTETCFEDDCVEIGDEWYYIGDDPEDNGIRMCPECEEYYVPSHGNFYSELTDEDYCCESCMEDAEKRWHEDNGDVYSQYDCMWYEDADEVITARWWRKYLNRYEDYTIYVESFNELVEDGEATEYCGAYYIDDVSLDGEPVHLLAESFVAA